MGILGIVSGAFGAYRRSALLRIAGWDVGPGEDGDLSLRLRKAGYRVVFAPYAQCLTNLPTSFWRLIKQRRRWEWAVVTFECRKHIDLANVFSRNFRLSNLALLMDRWLYSVFLPIVFWAYVIWLFFHPHEDLIKLSVLYYVCFLCLEFVQVALILYYSLDRKRDMTVCLIAPLMPFYHAIQRCISTYAVIEEMLSRRSFKDSFVPAHVRRVTWHW
jgi:cellulose synthase/poly-beta-1,6-N-acetylglucosamine synthase-like glycosyltransferase